MAYCSHWGNELPSGVNFCPSCGAKVGGENTFNANNTSEDLNNIINPTIVDDGNISPKSKAVAAILSCPFIIGLGLLGIHHFYLGNNKKGITYLLVTLLLSWLIIPAFIMFVLSLMDFIKILSNEFTDSEGKKVVKW